MLVWRLHKSSWPSSHSVGWASFGTRLGTLPATRLLLSVYQRGRRFDKGWKSIVPGCGRRQRVERNILRYLMGSLAADSSLDEPLALDGWLSRRLVTLADRAG